MKFNNLGLKNPIATKLMVLIFFSSTMFAVLAIVWQLYNSYQYDITQLEKRLDQVRISTLPSITKSLWGFDEEQLNIHSTSGTTILIFVLCKPIWNWCFWKCWKTLQSNPVNVIRWSP